MFYLGAAPRRAVEGAAVAREWELVMKIRTCATFKSDAFNTTTPKPSFVHSENFGDDLASWFMAKLRDRQAAVDENDPSQEDHGWYLTFKLNDLLYDIVVTYVPGNGAAPRWLACIERSVGLLGSMIGKRHRSVTTEVVQLINEVLVESQECRDVRWLFFDDVRRGNLENGSASPLNP
jgi:hypothetical protein